jgi:hypothetical protein
MHTYVCPNNPPCGAVVRTIVDADHRGEVAHLCPTKRRNGQPVMTPMVKAIAPTHTQRKAS